MKYYTEFEKFWDAEKAEGTCMHPVHNKITIDALRFDIGLGMEREVVASISIGKEGINADKYYIDDIDTSPNFWNWMGQFVHSTFGRYVKRAQITYAQAKLTNEQQWEHIKDALFRVNFSDGQVKDALQFDSFKDLVQYLHSKIIDPETKKFKMGAYVEAYWIVDNNMPWLHKTMGVNSFWASARGGAKRNGADYNHCRETSLGYALAKRHRWEEVMDQIWHSHFGNPMPTSYSREVRSRCFWLNSSNKRNNIFTMPQSHAIRTTATGSRYFLNTTNNHLEQASSGNAGLFDASETKIWVLRWDTLTVIPRNRYMGYPDYGMGNVSYFMTIPLLFSTGRAIYIKPFGIDTIYTNWFDPNKYEVQLHAQGQDYASHTYNLGGFSDITVNNNPHRRTGAILNLSNIRVLGSYLNRSKDVLPNLKFRLHKKGTPYVSKLSKSTLKTMNKGVIQDYHFFVLE